MDKQFIETFQKHYKFVRAEDDRSEAHEEDDLVMFHYDSNFVSAFNKDKIAITDEFREALYADDEFQHEIGFTTYIEEFSTSKMYSVGKLINRIEIIFSKADAIVFKMKYM